MHPGPRFGSFLSLALSSIFFLMNHAHAGEPIPRPEFPGEDTPLAERKKLYESARIRDLPEGKFVLVGNHRYPAKALPRYFEDSTYRRGARATRSNPSRFVSGALGIVAILVGLVPMQNMAAELEVRRTIPNAIACVGVGTSILLIWSGRARDPRPLIPDFNNYIKGFMDLPDKEYPDEF